MGRRNFVKIGAVVSTAALFATLAGCGEADSAEAADSVTIGTQPWLGYGPWYIAEENGYFDDAGVGASMVNFSEDSEMTAALGSGKLDLANMASHSALQILEQGIEGKIIMLEDTSLTADAILGGPGIESIADLKGKEVAFEEGSVSNLLLDYALNENGMTIDDIQPVPMAPSDAGAALAADRVPVAVTYEPYITETLTGREDVTELYTAAEREGLISDVLFVTQKAIDEKPDAIAKAVSAWGPAIDFYNSDTPEAQQIIAKAIGSEASELETAFEGVKFFSLEDSKEQLLGEYLDESLPSVLESSLSAGIVQEEPEDLSAYLTDEFLPAD